MSKVQSMTGHVHSLSNFVAQARVSLREARRDGARMILVIGNEAAGV